jgi:site-specific DNA-methyltransferase (adenine-specific)
MNGVEMSRVIYGDAREIDLAQFDRYQTIAADPPWFYNDQRKVRKDGATPTAGIGACHHYDQMTVEEICAMPVAQLAASRCHLYLWATAPLLPDALQVMNAWGFEYATVAFAWVKMNPGAWGEAQIRINQLDMFGTPDEQVAAFMDNLAFFGPGFYTGSNVELVLLGRRGKPFAHAKGRKAAQAIFAPRGEHSAKPERVQDLIEWMYPGAAPRLELFARRARVGWDVFGNEIQD